MATDDPAEVAKEIAALMEQASISLRATVLLLSAAARHFDNVDPSRAIRLMGEATIPQQLANDTVTLMVQRLAEITSD